MLKIKHFPLLVFVLIFINCAKEEPVTTEETKPTVSEEIKPLVSAVEIGNSELPYIKINTPTAVQNA
jgi:hypothetical protein